MSLKWISEIFFVAFRMIQLISLKQISTNIVIRNGKTVWEHGPYCWYFPLKLTYLGWPYREYIITAQNGGFCEDLLSENDFEAVLATFCCYNYCASASEAVQKINTDQNDYHKCLSCVTVCWIAKIYQSITLKKGWLLTY